MDQIERSIEDILEANKDIERSIEDILEANKDMDKDELIRMILRKHIQMKADFDELEEKYYRAYRAFSGMGMDIERDTRGC